MGKKSKFTQAKRQEFHRKLDQLPERRWKRGDAPKPWHDGMFTASAVGVALYVLYIRTLHPSVPGGDSGELIVSAHELGVAYVGSFVCGLSLCNQHTIVLYVAVIAVWVLRSLSATWVLVPTNLCKIAFYFGLGILPYLYLPLSAYMNTARWTWGDQRTILGFLTHLLRAEYGTFDLGKDQQGLGFLYGFKAYLSHLATDLSFIGPGLCIPGIIAAYRMWPTNKAPGLFVIMTTIYTCFFSWRANLNMSNPLFKGVVERFWMQSDIVVAVLAGLGLHAALKLITKSQSSTDSVIGKYVSLFMAAAITVIQLRNFAVCDQSNNYLVHDFAQSLLSTMPRNALVLTKGDLPTNTMRYLHLCENIRPDLDILDQEILSYGWSLTMIRKFYPKVVFPGDQWYLRDTVLQDGRQAFTFNTFLKANIDRRPVFVCIGMQEKDESWKKDFSLWPYGVCHRVVPVSKLFEPSKWAEETGYLAEKWAYPVDGYPETSWEKVANDEMWNAKISTAFFMYQQGTSIEGVKTKIPFLVKAYELYKRAIEKHKGKKYPTFWHKNYALAAEKLLHFEGHQYEQKVVCQESITNFEHYLQLDTGDGDRPSIEAAVETLKGRLNMMKQLEKVAETTENLINRATP